MKREVHRPRQCFRQRRLTDTGHVLHQDRPIGQERDDQNVEAMRFALNDRREVLFEPVQFQAGISQSGVGHR